MGWENSFFSLLIVNASGGFTGLYVYSPTVGAGNLIASVSASSGTDPYGNALISGVTSYNPAAGPPFEAISLQAGEVEFFSAAALTGPWTGRATLAIDSGFNLNIQPLTVNSNLSLQVAGGTGAVVAASLLKVLATETITGAGGGQLVITETGGAPATPPTQLIGATAADRALGVQVTGDAANFRLRVDTNGRHDWGPGNAATDTTLLRSGIGQLSTGGQLAVGVTAAPSTTADLEVHSRLGITESAAPATPPAGFGFLYANSTDKFLHYKDETGQDGTIPATQGDLTGITVTAAAATRITRNWNIPANNPAVAGLYRLKAWGNGTEGSTAQNLTWSVFFNSAAIQSVTAAALTASGAFRWWVELILMINTIGAGGTCNVNLTGNWATTASPTVENSFTAGSAAVNGTAINTTALNTLALAVAWASTTGAPTISELASTFERIGP